MEERIRRTPQVDVKTALQLLKAIVNKQRDIYNKSLERFSITHLCQETREIAELAERKGFQVYEAMGEVADVFLIGFTELDKQYSTAGFVSALAKHGLFKTHKLLTEGYQGRAEFMRRHKGKQSFDLEEVFAKFGLEPEGNDDFVLYRKQGIFFDKYEWGFGIDESVLAREQAVFEAMQAFVARQEDFLIPHMIEEEKCVYLLNLAQVVSLSEKLDDNELNYVSFVPRI